ncbi:MAG: hypothetical protein K0A89_07045 [ANME-2 cluster archaeon]|nr:hypothetical protein [ANME-2 cluster archaeon]
MKRMILLVLVLFNATLLISPGPASADSPRYLHITEISMQPQGSNVSFTVEYRLDFIARLYVLFLGSGNIEPAMTDLFYDFDDIKIISIKENHARVMAYNVGYQDEDIEGVFFYDSHKLGSTVDTFIMFPGKENPEMLYNVASTPNVFFRQDE